MRCWQTDSEPTLDWLEKTLEEIVLDNMWDWLSLHYREREVKRRLRIKLIVHSKLALKAHFQRCHVRASGVHDVLYIDSIGIVDVGGHAKVAFARLRDFGY